MRIEPSYQSNFRKNHSTTSALLNLWDKVMMALDKMATVVLFIDCSKAFDRLFQKLLYARLRYLGFDFTAVRISRII
nr:unnamed protein product [Callosobruchus chinensis]